MTTEATPRASILFVDDEPNVTDALRRALRAEPLDLLSATSAEEALRILNGRAVDVVVSDEQMPGMAGSAFLGLVRRRYPRTIRIILSGHASLEAAVRAINEGEVYRFFLKPCNPTDLKVTIRQALAHKALEEKSRRLLRKYQRQATVISRLEKVSPGITRLETDVDGAIIVGETDADGTIQDLLADIETAMRV